jgi:hypothetical protein
VLQAGYVLEEMPVLESGRATVHAGATAVRPREINILGQMVHVRPMPEQVDDSILGYCDVAKQSIFIRDNLAEGTWQSTLCHETAHYGGDSLGLDMTETQISGMGTTFYSTGVRIR